MSGIWDQLIAACQNTHESLADALRLALQASHEVGEDSEWIVHELRGYPDDAKPEQRRVAGLLVTPDRMGRMREVRFDDGYAMDESYQWVRQGVAELERVAKHDGSIRLPFGRVEDKDLYLRTHGAALGSIVDAVRSRLLMWALEHRPRDSGEEASGVPNAPKRESVQITFLNRSSKDESASALIDSMSKGCDSAGLVLTTGEARAFSAELPTWIEISLYLLALDRLVDIGAAIARNFAEGIEGYFREEKPPAATFQIQLPGQAHKLNLPMSDEEGAKRALSSLDTFPAYALAWQEVLGLDQIDTIAWRHEGEHWLPVWSQKRGEDAVDYDAVLARIGEVQRIASGFFGEPRKAAHNYDFAMSFAGEQRSFVEAVAQSLREQNARVFYDRFEEVDLWGKNLYEHFPRVYGGSARFCVMFVSKEYVEKAWPRHERRSAQAYEMKLDQEYILPVRFDDVEVPGLHETVQYVDARVSTPEKVASLLLKKLERSRTGSG